MVNIVVFSVFDSVHLHLEKDKDNVYISIFNNISDNHIMSYKNELFYVEEGMIKDFKRDFRIRNIRYINSKIDLERWFSNTLYHLNRGNYLIREGEIKNVDLTFNSSLYRGLSYIPIVLKKVSWSKVNTKKLYEYNYLIS